MAKQGRKNKYTEVIEPNLDKIKEFIDMGYEDKKMYEELGISSAVWFKYKESKKEFKELFLKTPEKMEQHKQNLLKKNTVFIQDILDDNKVSPETKLRYLEYYEKTRLGVMSQKDKEYFSIKKEELKIKQREYELEKEKVGSVNNLEEAINNNDLNSFLNALSNPVGKDDNN